MRSIGLMILLLLAATPPAVFSLDITETARMQVPDGAAIVPSESGWISHRPKLVTVYEDNLEPAHEKSTKLNERVEISDAGSYYSILKYNDNSPTTFSLLRVDVYNNAGERVYSVDKPRASSIRLSDADGSAVGIVGAKGFPSSELDVYDRAGMISHTLHVTFLTGISFEHAGDLMFVNSADSGLVAYDMSGVEVHRYGVTRNFCVSGDGEFVATTNSIGISYFKSGLKIKSITEAPGLTGTDIDMRFDSGASRLAVLGFDYLRVYSLPTLELIWDLKSRVPNARYSALDSSDDELIAVGYDVPMKRNGNTSHTQGGVLLLDWNGTELHNMELEYADWTIGHPLVRFSSGGKLLKIATRNEAYLLTISR
ncbi:MAG: hypothetical protein ABIK83_10255 [Candidatus Zixiibacteriota bacterium]